MAFDVGNAVGKIIIDSKGVVDGVNQAKGAFSTLEKAAGATMKGLAIAVVAGATAVAGLAVAAGKAAMNMEQAMADIAAVMGKTQDEVKPLKDLIQDLAVNPNLKVTAVEAADAVAMLARNGLDMTQIMEGAAEATVFLANATGGTFAQSADIMTDAMAIFGIEANNAIDAVNGITSVTTNSKFSIDDYALALAQGGGAASAAGVEFGDFNTAIAAISPLFASGSDAGTSFKVMMQRLVPASSTAADAMRELGIITADGANQFFDADGNLRSMAEIVGVLETAFGGLTEQQQNQALSTIFGTDAMRAAVGLMDTGKVSFEALAAAMAQTDAMDAAATRMDTLAGVIEIIKSLVEGFTLQIGDALLPLLRGWADALLDIAEKAQPVVEAISEFITKLVEGQDPFQAFQSFLVGLGEALGMSHTEALGLALRVTELKDAFVEGFTKIQELATELYDGLVLAFDGVKQLLEGDLTGALETFQLAWETAWTAIVEFVGTLWTLLEPYLLEAYQSIVTWFNEQPWGEIGQTVVDLIVIGLTAFSEKIQEVLATWYASFTEWANLDSWMQLGDTVSLHVIDGLGAGYDVKVPQLIADWTTGLAAWAESDGTSLTQIGVDVVGKVLDGLATFTTDAITTLTEWTTTLTGWVSGYDWSKLGYDVTTAVIEGLKGFVTLVAGAGGVLETWRQGFVDWASDIENWKALGQAVVDGIIAGWEFTESVEGAIDDFFEGVIKAVKDALDISSPSQVMIEIGEQTIQGLIDGILKKLADIVVAIGQVITSAKEPFETFDWASVGGAVVDGIANGISSTAGKIATAAVEAATAAWEAAKAFLGISSPSKVFYDLFSWVPEGAALGISDNVGVLLDAMSELGNSAAAAGAEAFGKVAAALSGIGDVLNVFAQLDAFRNSGVRVQDTVNYFAWFKNRILELMQHMAAAANIFAGNEEVVQQYSRSVSAVADAITKSTESFDALWAFRQGETRVQETVNYFAWFKNRILALMQHMAAAAAIFAGNEEVTQKYAESVGKVADSLIATAELIAALGQMEPATDIQQRIKIIVAIVQEMAAQFAAITVIPTTENAVSWIVGAVDNLMIIIQKLRDLASADVPGGIGEIVNAIIAQMSALPTAFNNIGVAAADSLINALLSAVPFLQQLSASIGAMIASDVAAAIVANQAVVTEAVTVVAGGRGYFPGGGGDTINSTSVNMFGGQSFGATSSPSSVINDITRLR